MRRTATEAEATRAEILAAARRLLATHGYAATSTSAVAAIAGVTKGALYHHFPDKAALLVEVWRQLDRELVAVIRGAAADALRNGADRFEVFMAGCAAYLEFTCTAEYQQIVQIDAPAAVGQARWRLMDTEMGLPDVERGIADMIVAGLIPPQPSRPLAILLLGALNGAAFALARGEPGLSKAAVLASLEGLVRPSPRA